MTTKIGLISDPHATPEPLAEALAIFQRVYLVVAPYWRRVQVQNQILVNEDHFPAFR